MQDGFIRLTLHHNIRNSADKLVGEAIFTNQKSAGD
jgi:hypothetical protein